MSHGVARLSRSPAPKSSEDPPVEGVRTLCGCKEETLPRKDQLCSRWPLYRIGTQNGLDQIVEGLAQSAVEGEAPQLDWLREIACRHPAGGL
jgi:hypothetical protein